MKKLVYMFVAVAAISFASCGGSTTPAEGAADSAAAPVVEETVDSTAADTTGAETVDSTAVEAAPEA